MNRTEKFNAHLRCFRGCPGEYSIFDVVYTCPDCGGLLEVHHDLNALRARAATEWKQLIGQRVGSTEWPYGSGVWSLKEWVVPDLHNDNVVSMFEGNSNLFWAERFGKQIGVSDLWIKMSGNSHTGSFKDLGMTVLVSVVKQMMSAESPVRAVACASTGDTSAALAAYAAAAGIPAVVILPRNKVSPAQLIQPIANGAHVLVLDTDFDGCMRIVKEVTQDNSLYLANSMNSLRIEGQKSVGVEIARQFDWEAPDWIVMPVGNLGNISALYKGLALMLNLGLIEKMPRLLAAQVEKANPFYMSFIKNFEEQHVVRAKSTLASAIQIGNPVSYEKAVVAIRESNGIVEQVSEHELANAAARADLTGMYTDPHTGAALAATLKLVERGEILAHHRVIIISTAHGLKFTGFKTGYHDDSLKEVESILPNPPQELAADPVLVKSEINRRLDKHEHN